MPKRVTTELYEFDELNDKAKERARDWYRECQDGDGPEVFDSVIEDAVRLLGLLGFEVEHNKPSRANAAIYWTLHVQGAGAWINGTWDAATADTKKLREEAPDTCESNHALHQIADMVDNLRATYLDDGLHPALWFQFTGDDRDHGHVGPYGINSRDEIPMSDEEEDEVQGAMQTLLDAANSWVYGQLVAEDEWQNSDECIDENIKANEYTFDEHGNRLELKPCATAA